MDGNQRVAIVTGAARPWGLGRAVARGLAEKGMAIVVADIRDDWGQEAAKTITDETGQKALYVRADIASRPSVKALAERTLKEFGRIDVLANVAGVVGFQKAEEMTDEHFDRLININLRGTMLTCQAAVPVMRRQGGGRIVNVSSLSALRPLEGLSMYAASKAAVTMYSKALALEVARDNIIVTVVAPSSLVTAMGTDRAPTQEEWERTGRGVPVGRALKTEEVAEVIIVAATMRGPALAGQVLHANGGAYMV